MQARRVGVRVRKVVDENQANPRGRPQESGTRLTGLSAKPTIARLESRHGQHRTIQQYTRGVQRRQRGVLLNISPQLPDVIPQVVELDQE